MLVTFADLWMHSYIVTHSAANFLCPLKSVRLFVVRYEKSDPLVPLIHYAEGKLLLREIILQILQIHNKASQRTHASAAACQSGCLSVRPAPHRLKQ